MKKLITSIEENHFFTEIAERLPFNKLSRTDKLERLQENGGFFAITKATEANSCDFSPFLVERIAQSVEVNKSD